MASRTVERGNSVKPLLILVDAFLLAKSDLFEAAISL
jgi:hypothetical protein